jgi:outer membrane protein with beta-barrel domain
MRAHLLVGCAAVAALTLGAAVTHAQSGRTGVTIYGGLTVATLHGDSVPGPLHTGGFAAGAALTWPVANHVAVQPELQYVQKGDDETDSFIGGVFTMHIRLNYIELPVLLRLSGDPIRGVTPFLIGGPEVAFKASCSIDVKGRSGNYTCADLPPAESTDWGAVAGGGLEVPIMGRSFSIGARYDWGLRDAFKDNQAKTRTLSLLLGWRVR